MLGKHFDNNVWPRVKEKQHFEGRTTARYVCVCGGGGGNTLSARHG